LGIEEKEYIFGERNGIYIIDLQKTLKMFRTLPSTFRTPPLIGKQIMFVAPSASAGRHLRRSPEVWYAVRQQPLAGRIAHELVTVQKSVNA